MTDLNEKIATAYGEVLPDIIFFNASFINVFTNELETGDIAVKGDTIVGIGNYYSSESNTYSRGESNKEKDHPKIIDCKGKIITPGFIDGHIHIESSMLTPKEFAKAVLRHGTTAVITDPHEITNVAGKDGLRYMLDEAEDILMDIYVMLPSCVPAMKLDESGAVIEAEDLKDFISYNKVLGLAEVMDFYGAIKGEEGLIKKIELTLEHKKIVDGHAPGISGTEVNAYVTAGITSDHECSTALEAMEKIRRGLWIMIREGTAAKNMEALKTLLAPPYSNRCMLVTDDKHPGELLYEGHMDALIKRAIALGANPYIAIAMATINPATYFGLKNRGAIAPGYKADLVILNDFEEFIVEKVYKDGVLVFDKQENILNYRKTNIEEKDNNKEQRNNHIENEKDFNTSIESACISNPNQHKRIFKSFHLQTLKPEDFYFQESGNNIRVLELISGQILTKEIIYPVKKDIDYKKMSEELIREDIVKLAVVERHHNTGHIGLGFLKGYGLKEGAVASSISHDSHNLMVAGCKEEDMAIAANHVASMQGGICIVKDKQVICELPLPVGGLMSDKDAASVDKLLKEIKVVGKSLGIREGIDPLMTLAFLSLSVIPELRVTTKGLLDVRSQKFISTFFD